MPNRLPTRVLGWVLFCALLLPTPFASAEMVDLTGYRIVMVDVQTEADLAFVEEVSESILEDYIGVRPMRVVIAPERMRDLEASGLRFEVLHENIQELIDAERVPAGRGTWDAYMTLQQQIDFINQVAAEHPDIAEVFSIGQSWENRDIWVLHLTGAGAGPKPALFYHATIHAREWITAPVVLYFLEYLIDNYGVDPCVTALVDRSDIYLSPCVNPDGYAYTWSSYRLWRKNRRNNGGGVYGVDLNRNWSLGWGGYGSSGSTSSETYRGPSAFSEPETQALRDFILGHPNITTYMDYHSYGQYLMWAWGYQCVGGPMEPDRTKFQMVGGTMAAMMEAVHDVYYEPGPICETIYQCSGVSVDYVYGEADRFAFTIELRDTGSYGFELPPSQILPTCEENLPALVFLSEWATSGVMMDLPDGAPAYVLEDTPTVLNVTITSAQENYASGVCHYRNNPSDPFSSVPLVHQSGNNYTATLPAATCGTTLEYYLTAVGDGGLVAALPCGAPNNVYTAQVMDVVPGPQPIYSYTLDSNPGWSRQGQWGFGDPAGYNGDPQTGYTGTNVYGYNLNGAYTNSMPQYHLTSTAIDCSNLTDVQVKFWRWLGVESATADHARFAVSNNGTNWTTIWENPGTTLLETSWSHPSYDISAVADNQPTVYLRWTMGTTNSSTVYCGWNIDDIEVWGVPPGPDCSGILLGDVSLDGIVNGADIQAFVEVFLDPDSATDEQMCAANFDAMCGLRMNDLEQFVEALLGL